MPDPGLPGACDLPGVEQRFGILGCQRGETLWTTGRVGPWLERSSGQIQLGAVAVQLDHALGETLYVNRGPGKWSLTTELTFDVLVPPPWHTGHLRVESAVVHRETAGGYSQGKLLDDGGQVLAVASTWARYVDGGPQGESLDFRRLPSPTAGSLQDLLGHDIAETPDGVRLILPETELWWNSYRSVHGGVWALLVELAASQTFRSGPSMLTTAHVHVSYLRRSVPGPVTVDARRVYQGRLFGEVEVVGRDVEHRVCVTGVVTGRATQ